MKIAPFLLLRHHAGVFHLLFFCLTVAAIIAQTAWAIFQDRSLTLAAERGNGLVAVRLLQEHASQTLQDAERKMLAVAHAVHASERELQNDETSLRALVNARLLDHGAIKALQFINRKGEAWVSSLDFPTHVNDVSRRGEIRFLLRNPQHQESLIGQPYQSRYDSQWVVPVVRNLHDRSGNWLGLISADVRVAYFAAVYARAARNNDAAVALFADEGFIIVRSPFEARYVGRDIANSPALRILAGAPMEGSFEHADFLDDEKSRLYTYRKVAGFPITTVYARDLHTIMAPWWQRSRDRILFSALTIALLGGLTFILWQHVHRLNHSRRSLRESENKFIDLFQHSPLPLALVDLSNDQFVEANQIFLRQFACTRADVIGRTPLEIHFWKVPEHRQRYLALLRQQTWVDKLEVQLLRQDGQDILCLLSARLLDAFGRQMVVFSPLDITLQRQNENEILDLNQKLEQRVNSRTQSLAQTNQELAQTLQSLKETQRELIQAEKMAALGGLVAGVANELYAPIENGMQTAGQLRQDTQTLCDTLGERHLRRSELIHFLQHSADCAATLLKNLLHASEMVSSFKQVAVDQASNLARQFELHRVLEEIVLTSAPLYRSTGLVLEMALQPDIVMHSYPGPISQAISNFITNAVLHGFAGRTHGKMRLSCRLLNTQQVEIVFVDDGVGMSPTCLAQVCEPFFTTKMGQGGNGLGMHVVYNLVTGVLGGTIDISSEVGQGTSLRLVLPRCAPGLR